MKMEHTLSASTDVTIASVEVSPGDQVNEGAAIVRFAKAKSEAA
jgi:acetyl/propionyl-CoA carboxylase alpha subunit